MPRRYYWMTIDDDGQLSAFKDKPYPSKSIAAWIPNGTLDAIFGGMTAVSFGEVARPKNWRTAIYRLEREK